VNGRVKRTREGKGKRYSEGERRKRERGGGEREKCSRTRRCTE